jgi:hypothetical protein
MFHIFLKPQSIFPYFLSTSMLIRIPFQEKKPFLPSRAGHTDVLAHLAATTFLFPNPALSASLTVGRRRRNLMPRQHCPPSPVGRQTRAPARAHNL